MDASTKLPIFTNFRVLTVAGLLVALAALTTLTRHFPDGRPIRP
jgi:hypothetical protein